MHFGRWLEKDVSGPPFVVSRVWQHLFEQVRERPVAEVVEKRRGQAIGSRFVVESLFRREVVTTCGNTTLQRLHDVRRAYGMCKTGVLGAREHQRR